jgi:hypothetical protein
MDNVILGIELDSRDVNVFKNIATAESYIEIPDIANWLAFDTTAVIYQIGRDASGYKVKLSRTEKSNPNQLLQYITGYLNRPHSRSSAESTLLEELVVYLNSRIT